MKPIRLRVSGLQSYREPQEIDFEQLCEAGVFGIFGPTGSGKSTLLDAMTLALYGKVERAPGGTQGIMNQAEKQLSVSFEFELSSAEGRRRYRVERQFKRSGEVSVAGTVCRFIVELPEGPQVLADKAQDVNHAVQETIGLTMTDFTRAVVLPQGKFAEFLSLTGKERRQMLQRLFHLEQYGDGLMARVSARFKETDIRMKETAAEQLGLGDASPEALQAARQEAQAAAKAWELQKEQLGAAEKLYAEAKQRWERQEQRQLLEQEQERLLSREPDIAELELRLQFSTAAHQAVPALREWKHARQAAEEREHRWAEALAEEAAAQNRAAGLQLLEAEAQRQLAEQEPGLTARLEQLKQAVLLQEEVRLLEERQAGLLAQHTQIAEQRRQASGRLERETQLLERARVKQAELKQLLAQSEVKAEDRQRLQRAVQERQGIAAAESIIREVHREGGKLKQELEELALRQAKLGEAQEQLVRDVYTDCRTAVQRASGMNSSVRLLSGLLADMPEAVRRLRLACREQQLQQLVHAFAAGLQEGEACPVCGSLHHPKAASASAASLQHGGHEADRGEAAAGLLEQLQKQGTELEYSFRLLEEKSLQLQRQMHLFLTESDGAGMGSAGAVRERTPADSDRDPSAAGQPLLEEQAAWSEAAAALQAGPEERLLEQAELLTEACASMLEGLKRERSAYAAAVEHAQAGWQRQQDLRQKLEREHADVQARYHTLHALFQESELKLSGAQAELEQAASAWRRTYEGLPYEQAELERLLQQLTEQERQADELRERLGKSEPFIEEKRQVIDSCKQELAELDRQAAETKVRLESLASQLEDKRRQVQERTGGEDAAVLAAAAEGLLQQLRRTDQQAKRDLEQAREALHQCGLRLSAAAQAKSSAQEAELRSGKAWQEALAETSFADETSLSQALLGKEQHELIDRQVKQYRDQLLQVQIRLQSLIQELGEALLTKEAWEQAELRYQAGQQAYEEALQLKARAERQAEELEDKHRRWRDLEDRRQRMQEVLERLGKLQTVFRGNAFVEFVAEEQLMQVSRAASERLKGLTRQRYALEVDSGGGFVIRDDANGGLRRPVSTLSGGETFLTSLALALALSAQIQLRGQYPLEFFFLDEGFGTLDPELLDTVVTALEKLHTDRLAVGVISHVPELRARLARRLIVVPAEPGGRGSQLQLETL
ncbi:SMC family ATPase [Paenibacillus sp. y28]|uniref:SMC family ATPase n=1 Tax=Paenibacillus sp. y28 TaxID=3129110 RepID=UPI003016DCFE